MTALPVLVVEHEAVCPPGWVGEWLVEAGCELDVRRPYAGDDLPGTLDGHRSMLVLGGSMDAYADDRHPWLTEVKVLVHQAAEGHVPVLGICLGHQLAAVALGGAVRRNPNGQQLGVVEMGWAPAAQADPLLSAVASAPVAVQWNSDVVTVPPTATQVLARAASGELQAARFAPSVWGVQCHPEAGAGLVSGWAESDRADAAARGLDVDGYVASVADATDELRARWRPLAERFAGLDRKTVASW